MDKRAVEVAIESWSNEQIAALLVSVSRLLQLRLESREASPDSEWSAVTSVTVGGKGGASSSTAAGPGEQATASAGPSKGQKGLGKGLQRLLCAISSASIVKAPALETNGTIRTTDVITTGGCSSRWW